MTATVAGDVQVAAELGFDFTRHQTFSWRIAAPAGRPDVQLWIERAVEAELAKLGVVRVDRDADLELVSYAILKLDAELWSTYANSPTWDIGVLRVQARDVGEGALILQVKPTGSERAVWGGLVRAKVDPAAPPGKIRRRIERAVSRLFRAKPQVRMAR